MWHVGSQSGPNSGSELGIHHLRGTKQKCQVLHYIPLECTPDTFSFAPWRQAPRHQLVGIVIPSALAWFKLQKPNNPAILRDCANAPIKRSRSAVAQPLKNTGNVQGSSTTGIQEPRGKAQILMLFLHSSKRNRLCFLQELHLLQSIFFVVQLNFDVFWLNSGNLYSKNMKFVGKRSTKKTTRNSTKCLVPEKNWSKMWNFSKSKNILNKKIGNCQGEKTKRPRKKKHNTTKSTTQNPQKKLNSFKIEKHRKTTKNVSVLPPPELLHHTQTEASSVPLRNWAP